MTRMKINGQMKDLDLDEDTPLLWAIRDHAGLTGTKFGCGKGLCGACTVMVDGQPVRSCSVPAAAVAAKSITTIEGLGQGVSARVQEAWIAEQVPQCGYCQSGQIMAATALLTANPTPDNQDINDAMTNICRCGTYVRIRRAIHTAAAARGDKP